MMVINYFIYLNTYFKKILILLFLPFFMKEFEKIYARLKYLPEDFIVEEIGDGWECRVSDKFGNNKEVDFGNLDLESSKDFLWCELEKKDIDHFSAIKELSEKLCINSRDIGYAGTKDKVAWTVQRISLFKPDVEKLKNFRSEKIVLKNFKWMKRKIKLGYLDSNNFKIILRDVGQKEAIKVGNEIRKKNFFPNYFGAQRFGAGNKNVEVGKLILKKRFGEAAKLIKGSWEGELNDEMGLKFLKRIERKNLLMIINSVQSYFFNEVLRRALEEGLDFTKQGMQNCLLIGYKSKFYDGRLGEIEKEVLAEMKFTLEDFDLREISYLRIKGSFRKALVFVKDLDLETKEDEVFEGSKKIILSFTLDSGVYATTFLEGFFEFIETK